MPKRQKSPREKGYFPRVNKRTGEVEHRIRISWYGKMTWFGPYRTKTEALHAIQDKQAEQRQHRQMGPRGRPTTGTVEELITQDLADLEGQRTNYRELDRYGRFWKDRLGHRPIFSLEPKDVRAGIVELRRQGLAPRTVRWYVGYLRAMMRRMVRPRSWMLDFWADIELPAPTETPQVILTQEQEDRLYEALAPLDRLYTRLGMLLGIRISQLFTLRWEWINWQAKTITLPAFKRHPSRLLPLPEEAVLYLDWLRAFLGRPEQGWVFPVIKQTFRGNGRSQWKPGPLVFQPGVHLNPRNWYTRRYKPAVARAGLPPGVTFHTLRRTWASRAGNYVPAPVLKALGGWSDLTVADRYCQPFLEEMRRAMEQAAKFAGALDLRPTTTTKLLPHEDKTKKEIVTT